jgi:hypothetical protein
MCQEIVERYDVDGIHLDYIRYPEAWKQKVSKSRGRENITAIVRAISNRVKSRKPWVKMSCSPIGKYDDLPRYSSRGWNARSVVCQDAVAWMNNNLMDALFPMMYFQGNNFFPFAVDWQEHSYGRMVVPGLAVYMMHPREKNWNLDVITREMSVLRQLGLGYTFFRSKFFTDNTKGIYDFTRDFNIVPALVPPMTWAGKQAPSTVNHLQLKRGMVNDMISWQKATDNSGADYLLYNVYASETLPVDVNNPENLIATRQRELSITVPHKGHNLYYAVTAMTRYGMESEAACIPTAMGPQGSNRFDFRELIMGNKLKKYKSTKK